MADSYRLWIVLFGLGVVSACSTAEYPEIQAFAETDSVASTGDAADDPAIWLNHTDLRSSLILGTDKQRGLEVYDLAGNRTQTLEVGNLNNVDVRQAITWGDGQLDLAIGSNRTTNSLSLFRIDEQSGEIEHLVHEEIPLELPDPYGLCLYNDGESTFAFVNDKDGRFQQWLLAPDGKSELVREFLVDSQPEGCVVDDAQHTIYYGEEEKGLWKRSADPESESSPVLVADVRFSSLVADVEGIAIHKTGEKSGHILVSSQGDDSFAVFTLGGMHTYLGSFRIGDADDGSIDGVTDTDGIAITSASLTADLPEGLLVVQDGNNTHPNARQNFKLIDWRNVSNMINRP